MVIRSTLEPENGPSQPLPMPLAPPAADTAAATAMASQPAIAAPDAESDVDCCENRDLLPGEETPDDELPAATGGVA
jgi:hypothetical protein